MKKKKAIVILIVIIVLLLAAAAGVFMLLRNRNKGSDELVYVDSVANITGSMYTGQNRYMGIVESQEINGVQKDTDKKVKEVFVKVEDVVKTGDKLFEYDTDEMTLKLRQLELELTSIYNGITTMNQQIADLVEEREQASAEGKIEYTAQIQNYQAQVNQSNYDASAKQLEIDRQSLAIQNSIVYSPMDGIISEIKDESSSGDIDNGDYYPESGDGTNNYYISIMAMGDYRIKGTASEMNVRSMSEGQPVIIRSRMDDNTTWKGTITSIDLEHPDNGNNDNYYYSGSSEMASKYPFYIELESIDGLMLGQHLYVELDYGQGESKDGLWLDEFYIIQDGANAYVWAEDKKGRIEKRKIALGQYDEELMKYEILSGLNEDDYIAYPEERIREGMKATHNYEDVIPSEEDYIGAPDEFNDENMQNEEDFEIIDIEGYEEDTEIYDTDEIPLDQEIEVPLDQDILDGDDGTDSIDGEGPDSGEEAY